MNANTTRRDLLRLGTAAAAYTAGAAIVTGGVALATQAQGAEIGLVDRAAWDARRRHLDQVLTEDAAFDARYMEAYRADALTHALEEEWSASGERLAEAQWALFNIPAPDRAALLWKSEHLFGEDADKGRGSASWAAGTMALYMADARRLLAQEGR